MLAVRESGQTRSHGRATRRRFARAICPADTYRTLIESCRSTCSPCCWPARPIDRPLEKRGAHAVWLTTLHVREEVVLIAHMAKDTVSSDRAELWKLVGRDCPAAAHLFNIYQSGSTGKEAGLKYTQANRQRHRQKLASGWQPPPLQPGELLRPCRSTRSLTARPPCPLG